MVTRCTRETPWSAENSPLSRLRSPGVHASARSSARSTDRRQHRVPSALCAHANSVVGVVGRRILLVNVIAEVGIVITGGLVRLTGSGLGCPTWPECTDGSLVPVPAQSEGLHKFIEFGNRLLTFAVLVAAVAALVVVLRPWLARVMPNASRALETRPRCAHPWSGWQSVA